jgi:hypothetical protein
VLNSEQVGDGLDRQNIGIEVNEFGKLSEPERMKLGEGSCEIGPTCKRGSEMTCTERVDIN